MKNSSDAASGWAGNLVVQLTLCQPGGRLCPHLRACPPGIENLTASLNRIKNIKAAAYNGALTVKHLPKYLQFVKVATDACFNTLRTQLISILKSFFEGIIFRFLTFLFFFHSVFSSGSADCQPLVRAGLSSFGQLASPHTPVYWEPLGSFITDYWEPLNFITKRETETRKIKLWREKANIFSKKNVSSYKFKCDKNFRVSISFWVQFSSSFGSIKTVTVDRIR